MSCPTRAVRGIITLAGVLLAITPVASFAGPVTFTPGLSIAWQDCRAPGGAGFDALNFGCASNIVSIPLFPAFVLETPVDSVFAMELVIDVNVATDPLPEWWRMEPGGCRAGGWAADASLAGSCLDAWSGKGTAASQGWIPTQPGNRPNHGRLLVAASVLPDDAVALDALAPYTACRVLLRTNSTTDCPGCDVPACLVFNSLLLRRLPGSSVEEVFLAVPESPGSNMVTWQGIGADCNAVPVRHTTWGAVKALYR